MVKSFLNYSLLFEFYIGKSWKYQITKPKEFKFSKENHEKSRNRKKSETTFYTKKIPLQNISKNLDTNHVLKK